MRESATDVSGSDDLIDEKINTMIENLKSDDSRIVSESIKTLGAFGGSRELDALLSVISSNEYIVHHADAIEQIHNIKVARDRAIVPLLDCAVGGVWPEIRNGAFLAISDIGGKEAFEALKGVLYDDEWTNDGPQMVSVSAILNGGFPRDSLVEIFLSTIRSPITNDSWSFHANRLNRFRVQFGLKTISNPESIETSQDYILAMFLWRHLYRVRNEACRAMRELGENRKLVSECYSLLQNQNASVRHSATYCLGLIHDARTVEKLEEIWREDDDQIVRNCAVLSLVGISTDNYWTGSSSLGTPKEIRRMAVRAILNLEEIGIDWLRHLANNGADEWTKVEIGKFLGTN